MYSNFTINLSNKKQGVSIMKKALITLLTLALLVSFSIFSTVSASAEEENAGTNSENINTTENLVQNETSNESIEANENATIDNNAEEAELNSIRPDDTIIDVQLLWQDNNGGTHPLAYTKIEAYRRDALTNFVKIDLLDGYEYTNINGRVTISFANAIFADDCDIFLVVYAQGMDVSTFNADDELYCITIESPYLENLSPGTYNETINIFDTSINTISINSSDIETYRQAFEITQYAIYSSIYYEYLKGDDVEDVSIIFPHEDERDNSFYRASHKDKYYKIFVQPSHSNGSNTTFSTCDVITHEYGHHIFYCEIGIDTLGGWHSGDMAAHYKNHFTTTTASNDCDGECAVALQKVIDESECKESGCRIAWSEGVATVFGELAQQYFANEFIIQSGNDSTIPFWADEIYTRYYSSGTNNSGDPIEEFVDDPIESNEVTVINILYDICDTYNSTETWDLISISDRDFLEFIIAYKPNTLNEFITYFKTQYLDGIEATNLGTLLSHYEIFTIESFSIGEYNAFALTLFITWNPSYTYTSPYYEARRYQANFYDSSYELIGSTNAVPFEMGDNNRYILTVDGDLWTTLMNYYTDVYISITLYECDGDVNNFGNDTYYSTGYESSYLSYSIPTVYEVLSYDESKVGILNGDFCKWYKFTAKWADTYVFETTGDIDTWGDIFPIIVAGDSTRYRITSDDDAGEGNNFKISIYLEKNQTIYIRVREYDWYTSGAYTIKVIAPNHTHLYTNNYATCSSTQHYSYCICGAYIIESHQFMSIPSGNRCKYCSYFTKFVEIPFQGITLPPIDNSVIFDYNEDEEC